MGRFLVVYTRLFILWVALFGLLAYAEPRPFAALKPALPWFFAVTMFGIGAILETRDFANIVRSPGLVLLGSAAQFTIMPLGGFVLARLFRLPSDLAVGLVLTGAAPGAMASNVMSYLARADTAYSVSLTTVSTLLCPVLTPGLTLLLARTYLDVPFWGMFGSVVAQVIAPLLAGLALRWWLGEAMRRIEKVFPAISVTFIVFICSLVIALNHEYLAELTGLILAVCLLLNVGGMIGGYGVGAMFRLDVPKRRTLSIEIGMQNAGLGSTLALQHFGARAAVPCAVFVFVCIVTASIMARIWNRRPADVPAAAPTAARPCEAEIRP